jgi:hypothetical protein
MKTLSCRYFNAVSEQLLNGKIDYFAGSTAPSLTLSADPTAVGAGGSTTLSWSAANVSSCAASDGWSGSKPTNGSETLTPAATAAYTLTCSGGNGSATRSVTVTLDALPPAVAITAPAPGASVGGTVSVAASATDDQGVARVDFFDDGGLVGADNSSPYSVTWNTAAEPAGSHTLTAQAVDAAGNVGVAAPVPVSVAVDTQPPVVTIVAPADGAAITVKTKVRATASDNVKVSLLELYLDGVRKASTTTSTSKSFYLYPAKLSAGSHAITATATDSSGNATSTTITVHR